MLRVHLESLELIRSLRPLLDNVRKQDSDLASQIRRAASSIVLNVAEAGGREGKDATRFFRIARGSALEVEAGLELADAWGVADREQLSPALDSAGNVCRMLYGLVR